MLARVKQDYLSGSVTAFSGREYIRSEWREVPAGFEEQAKNHPLLDVQPSLDEIRAHGPQAPGLQEPAAVTAVTSEAVLRTDDAEPEAEPEEAAEPAEPPAEDTEPTESKPSRRRKRGRR